MDLVQCHSIDSKGYGAWKISDSTFDVFYGASKAFHSNASQTTTFSQKEMSFPALFDQ
jgi:hypothetical protein